MSEDNYSNENKNVALNNQSKNDRYIIEDVSIFIENGIKKRRCGCGCGEVMDAFDRQSRARYFVRGHNKRPISEQDKITLVAVKDLDESAREAMIMHLYATVIALRDELNYARIGADNLIKMYNRQITELEDRVREFEDLFQEYHPDWALMEHELREMFKK